MTNNSKYYFCTRPKIYTMLVQAQIYPEAILPHYKNPRYHVWMFENTPEVRKIVEDYFANI